MQSNPREMPEYPELLCLCFCSVMSLRLAQPTNMTGHEKLLFHNVTSGYNAISRPVLDANHKVRVSFGISLNQILDLDGKHQILSTYMWINEKWTDENLVWRPEDFNGLEKIMFPATHIWVPDIYIFNVAGGPLDGFVNVSGSTVAVTYKGLVQWSIPLLIKSACPVDATFFPYDKQSCDVFFGSWIYDISQIDIDLAPTALDLSQYVVNNEFDLHETNIHKSVVNSSCCPGEGDHPMVQLKLHVKRKTIYYDYIVIAPTINLCVLTLATFLLPCECGWKIAIGLTVFLTLYVLQLLIAENVPDTNSTPLISVFLLLVMSLNCISLIMATIVMNIKKRSQLDPVPKVPATLLYICETFLSRLACTRLSDWKKIASMPTETSIAIEKCMVQAPGNTSCDSNSVYSSDEDERINSYLQLRDMSRSNNADRHISGYNGTDTQSRNGDHNSIETHTRNTERTDDDSDQEAATMCRTETTESTFSTVSANDTFTQEIPYTDKLISTDAASLNNGKRANANVNHSFTAEKDTDTADAGDTVLSEGTGTPETYKCSRNRPSYRRAIRHGSQVAMNYVSLSREGRGRSIRRRSVFWGVSMKYQWYFVADVIDTTAFLIYVCVMFIGILSVLVIVPIFA